MTQYKLLLRIIEIEKRYVEADNIHDAIEKAQDGQYSLVPPHSIEVIDEKIISLSEVEDENYSVENSDGEVGTGVISSTMDMATGS